VLAGHSFGGLYVLNFATRFPDEVAGLVLIDSTAPASAPAPRTSSAGSYEPMSRVSALLSTSARFGLTRLYASLDYGSLPPRSRDEARAGVATAENLRSTIDEYVQGSASANEAAALEDFGHKPLFVLTAGEGTAAGWMAKQDRLAALSTNSVHRVVDGAAHVDLVMNERPAAATSQAILDVVSSVRSGRPLNG
jgi:pimeloyl-ACP methyl ester carboxylesterase